MTAAAAEARLTVDLDALAANYRCFVKMARGAEVAPAVKADAYGLGAARVGRRLHAEGARSFFVARLSEGEALRDALEEATIYVLDGCLGGVERLQAARLTPVLNDLAEVETLGAYARRAGRPLPCALHFDTGFNRLGLRAEEVEALVASPDRLQGLEVGLVMSHLACATDPEHPMSWRQVGRFKKLAHLFPKARKSLANSAGVYLGEDFLFELARPGIGLYGGGPFAKPHPSLKPVATFEAPILQVRTVRPGETVGYGGAWTAERPTRIAILGAGYADGVLRSQSPNGYAWFEGRRRPLLGRVSMDLIAVEVDDAETARPGAMVELIGPHVQLDEAAGAGGTIAYELLVRIGARARRIYIGEAA